MEHRVQHASRGGDADLAVAVLRPVRGHHAFESCVEQLATAIRLGAFPYGSTLPPERDLAARLGVSRATLREAIAALRTAGVVRTTRGRGGGTVVRHRPESPQQGTVADLDRRRAALLDSLTFRRVVEPGACHLAARRRLGEDHRHLLLTALKEVSGAPDAAAHRQADARLHLALATVTESPLVVEAVTRCQADLHDMLSAIPVLEVNIEHSSAQHEAIVEAVLAGTAGRARRVMEAHCDDTAALLRGLLG